MRDKLAKRPESILVKGDDAGLLLLPRPVREELERLLREELQAWRRKDAVTAITCRLLWCDKYLQAGGHPVAGLVSQNLQRHIAQIVTAKERWKRRLKAAPLVAVVKRECRDDGDGIMWIETLACGHERDDLLYHPGDAGAHHRRCYECGDLNLAIADAMPSQPRLEGAE